MGRIVLAGHVVAVKEVVLAYFRSESRAKRRCAAERAAGIDARVFPVFFSSALSESA